MAGYARRPGVAPLSRARSLVIPDAPAFYERRSCLPQLDCERPQARDLESHFFGIRPTFMCYVPSPVLASVGDTDLGYGKGKGTMHGPSGAQNTHFGGEKLGDLEEANPFSFKEFLKSKNLGLSKEDTDSRIYSKEATRHSLGLGRSSPTSQAMGYGLEHQQPFFEDPTGAGDLLDEDEDEGWDGAYLPSAVEQTHSSRVAASTSPCSTYVSFFSNPSELVGPESLPPCMLSDSDSRVSPAGSPSTDFTVHGESLGDRHLRTLQISYEALKDENSKLRRKLTEVQSFSETQTEIAKSTPLDNGAAELSDGPRAPLTASQLASSSEVVASQLFLPRVRTLERKLEAKMIKEESDYHDLESVVQQVEQNLERMTKRAVKAENHVLKLKQEISLLQVTRERGLNGSHIREFQKGHQRVSAGVSSARPPAPPQLKHPDQDSLSFRPGPPGCAQQECQGHHYRAGGGTCTPDDRRGTRDGIRPVSFRRPATPQLGKGIIPLSPLPRVPCLVSVRWPFSCSPV
ncbi:endosome-associated-trafficking regulator 1 isoform X1 [Tursiops truncatus]|uniref:Endosome-associated-trafficking regulator 1 n=3 Tax=Tursiops truncatus TaxID=9739 RepID=A0A6J3RJK6_TURTR|nr:endosome-associated-trafficking regulator 1 isoform X1 [Tursiops truncatus]